jgi:hypothetical protein
MSFLRIWPFGPSTTYTGESTHPTYYSRDEANFNEGIF